jgi:protein-disulfide isomerase
MVLGCVGCDPQPSSSTTDVSRKVERQVRNSFSVPPNAHVTVGTLTPSAEWTEYDSVIVTVDGTDGKKNDYTLLVSKDRSTMLHVAKYSLLKDPFDEIVSKIDVKGRPVRGARTAKVTVVDYDDFECPFCSRMHQTLFPQILKEYGDRVAFIYRDYPLAEIHPWATHAAVDANCLADQSVDAYWDFADYVHAHQKEVNDKKAAEARYAVLDHLAVLQGQEHNLNSVKLAACIEKQDDSAVKASKKEGSAIGVSGTPALFINGQKLEGTIPVAELRAALDEALRDAGAPISGHASETGTH